MGRPPRASLLALLLAAVVLFLPAPGGLPALEAKGGLMILALGALAVWALARGIPALRPPNAVAGWAWALAAAHALSGAAAGLPPEAAFRTAGLAALALALGWASRAGPAGSAILLRTLAALGGITGLLVSVQRACLLPGAATFDHKGLASAFLSISLPACLALSCREVGRWRAASLASLALASCGLAVGETRAAWIAGAAGVLPFLLFRPRRILAAGAVALAAGIAGGLLASGIGAGHLARGYVRDYGSPGAAPEAYARSHGIPIVERFTSIWRNREPRIVLWQASARTWRERPLLGHGPGSFVSATAPAASRLLTGTRVESFSTYAHNDLLQTAVEGGLLALAALLALGAAAARAALRGRDAACLGGLLAGGLNALLCFPLYDPGCALALAVLAGLAAGAPDAEPAPRPRPGWAVLAALAVLLSLRPQRPSWPGEARREAGRRALFRGEIARGRRHLERAVLEAPWDPRARMGLAHARLLDRDPAGAYAALAGALRDFPFESGAQIRLAWARMLLQEGDASGARLHLDYVIRKYSGTPEAGEALALRAACPSPRAGARMPR